MRSETIPDTTATRPLDEPQRYVSFTVGGEEYGADIQLIQEIKVWDTVTRVPHMPKYLLGVLNLRGVIIPVLDLRLRFGLDQAPFESTTVIIVLRVPSARGARTVGVVVDAVNEVHEIAPDQIQPPPLPVRNSLDQAFIKGIVTLQDRMIILLNIDPLINAAAD